MQCSVNTHWVPLITNNLIHNNLLVISGIRCDRTFNTDVNQKCAFPREKIVRYSWVLVVTELVVREHSIPLGIEMDGALKLWTEIPKDVVNVVIVTCGV